MDYKIKTSDREKRYEITKRLKEFFSISKNVIFVFLFGSFAKGNVTPLSDIDIAAFFRNTPDFYRINDMREELSELLNIAAVDIVVLNNASPIIKMQVLKKGNILVNKVPGIYNSFFVSTVKEYDDLKQLRKEVEENILRGKIYA
ncbi:MAG: nucleotidyltransferase domain-containing protein [Nitrospirota bacterium]